MEFILPQLQKDLSEYTKKCGSTENSSLLDFLFYNYLSSQPIDDGRIAQCENMLAPVFSELSLESSDQLFDLIADLCAAYQRAAFIEGIRIGVQLSREFTDRNIPTM